ncbi:MAG: polysaccharide biosynthesis/export family protein [Verrucomicrobiota bacterium]
MKKLHLSLAAVLPIVCFAWAAFAARAEDADDRRIAPSDIIIVEVFGEKDLCGEHRVQQGGTIKYPLLGNVYVAGKTPSEVATVLAEKLEADYLVDPQVNVMVKEYRLRTVSVIGKVNREGAVELPAEQKIDIIEGIARAGGLSPLANKNKIELSRNGKTTMYKFDDVKKIKDPQKKVWLEPGDVIYVHESLF